MIFFFSKILYCDIVDKVNILFQKFLLKFQDAFEIEMKEIWSFENWKKIMEFWALQIKGSKCKNSWNENTEFKALEIETNIYDGSWN